MVQKEKENTNLVSYFNYARTDPETDTYTYSAKPFADAVGAIICPPPTFGTISCPSERKPRNREGPEGFAEGTGEEKGWKHGL